jgi:hypothetical protein
MVTPGATVRQAEDGGPNLMHYLPRIDCKWIANRSPRDAGDGGGGCCIAGFAPHIWFDLAGPRRGE